MRILTIDSPMMNGAFQELGHQTFHVGYRPESDLVVDSTRPAMDVYRQVTEAGFFPDFALWVDSSNLPFLPGIEELPCVSLFYSIDTYCHVWHFGFAHAFDAVLVAQKDHLALFPLDDIPGWWLPLFAVSAEVASPVRDIPVSFVGTRGHPNNPDRAPFLADFRRRHPLVIYSGPYAEIFSRSRIVLNQTACSEVNFRCFEAMACGAALLMEYCDHGLPDLFTPGETVLPLYRRNDAREAAAIAHRALSDPARLAEIAVAGRQLVLREHMSRNRARTVLEKVEALRRDGAAESRAANLARRRRFLSATYAMLAQELGDRLGSEYSRYYYSLSAAMGGQAG